MSGAAAAIMSPCVDIVYIHVLRSILVILTYCHFSILNQLPGGLMLGIEGKDVAITTSLTSVGLLT